MSFSPCLPQQGYTTAVPSSDRLELARARQFVARLASTEQQRDAVYRLRFKVFNLELNEGLESAFATGRDVDEFDQFCDHVLIEDSSNGEVVGTYRMQPGAVAEKGSGYYSAREFDFTPFMTVGSEVVELGRACILSEYRNYEVLSLLWRAVALYANMHGARYLVGCSSITSQDPAVGLAMYNRLSPHYEVDERFRTVPTPEFAIPADDCTEVDVRVPRLLRAYLSVGAKICGPPALDREFKTIDFLTLLDLETMSRTARAHFFK